MQDPSMYQHVKPPITFPEQEHLKCPRCESNNTKFCYYNNYNLSQPRHFCKNCRRYWTKGGALRNIPVGGGTRKSTKKSSNPKRPSPATSAAATSSSTPLPIPKPEQQQGIFGLSAAMSDQERRFLDIPANFGSLLVGSGGQFGNLMEGLNPNEQLGEFAENPNTRMGPSGIRNASIELQGTNNNNSESFLGVQRGGGDSSCWGGGGGGNGNGWPDLAIYTPGSNFQ